MTKNYWLYVIPLMLLSSAVSAITPLPPEGASVQPQGGCSATASCGTGQVASVRPANPIAVTLPGWCKNPDKTSVEQMICTVPDIAKSDNDLNRLYQMSPNSEMVASRRSERDACATAECVRQWYQKWLAQMTMGDQPQSYQAPIQRQPAPPMVTQYAVPAPPSPVMMPQSGATSAFTYWQASELTTAEQRLQQMQVQLAELDNQLNVRWKSRSRSRKETTAQKAWLQQRDTAIGNGASADQIAQMYRQRIAQL